MNIIYLRYSKKPFNEGNFVAWIFADFYSDKELRIVEGVPKNASQHFVAKISCRGLFKVFPHMFWIQNFEPMTSEHISDTHSEFKVQ